MHCEGSISYCHSKLGFFYFYLCSVGFIDLDLINPDEKLQFQKAEGFKQVTSISGSAE